MTTQQHKALRLADLLEFGVMLGDDRDEAAAELRRLHGVNAQLLEALELIPASGSMLGEQAEGRRLAAIAAAKGEA